MRNGISNKTKYVHGIIKIRLAGLRQFLKIDSPLNVMKNAFYFMLKALFVLEIFKFLS